MNISHALLDLALSLSLFLVLFNWFAGMDGYPADLIDRLVPSSPPNIISGGGCLFSGSSVFLQLCLLWEEDLDAFSCKYQYLTAATPILLLLFFRYEDD